MSLTLHTALKKVQKQVSNGTIGPHIGICFGVVRVGGASLPDWKLLDDLFRKWPKFSGDISYPVPDPEGRHLAPVVFSDACRNGTMWTGAYGDLRKELLQFLITETQS